MQDVRREAGVDQHFARGRVDLEAADGAAGADAVLDEGDGGVARAAAAAFHAAWTRSGTLAPVKAIQVMSA